MIVAFDNSFLTLVLNPDSPPRPNPATGVPVTYCRERIEALIDRISGDPKGKVVIPTPSFAEALIASPDAEKLLAEIRGFSCIEIVSFDARSAIELAEMTSAAKSEGDKRSGSSGDWQLIKLDRQIVATAKAHGASILYTDDDRQTNFANRCGLKVVHTWDLDLPDKYAQHNMMFEGEHV